MANHCAPVLPSAPSIHVSLAAQLVSTKTYGHLNDDDQAWFIADSFQWLVDQDRGESMRAHKVHVCYVCGAPIPVGERYRRLRGGVARINVKIHEPCYRLRRQESTA